MEELRADDIRVLGAYVLLARLTPAGGEPRLLARRPAAEGLAEITLVRDEHARATTAALRAAAGPGFPELLEDGTAARPPWLAWRYVPALTLAEAGALMYAGLPHGTVRALAGRLAAPLARLHARGVPHGALTADAVLLTPDGPRLTRPRRTGTAPDDIAALGDLLTHAGAGRAPDDPLLRRCSHEEPEQRPSAQELLDELGEEPFEAPARLVGALARQADRALALESATDTPPRTPAARPARRTLLTAAGAGLLLGAGSVAGWVTGRGGTQALTSPAVTTRRTTTGATAVRGTPPAALWRYDSKNEFLWQYNGLLWHSDGKVIYLVEHPELTALSMTDGRPVWQRGGFDTRETLVSTEPGTLILTRNDRFLAVSTADGRQRWTERTTHPDLTVDAVAGYDRGRDLLYYRAVGRENTVPGTVPRTYVIAFDTAARAERWRLKVPAGEEGEAMLEIAPDDLKVMYAVEGGVVLADVDPRTGTMGRPFRHTWTPSGGKLSVNRLTGHIYAFGDGRLSAAPLRVNKPVWRLNLSDDGGPGEPPVVSTPTAVEVPGLGTVLYVTDARRNVFAIDPVRGREIWRRTLLPDPPYALVKSAPGLALTRSRRTLLAFGRGAGVVALDPRNGAVKWTFQSKQSASSLYEVHTVNDIAVIMNGASVFAFPAG
ncbi:outer membrane protein assembly factor BamB family protein [Streptomyces sp. NPDC001658]